MRKDYLWGDGYFGTFVQFEVHEYRIGQSVLTNPAQMNRGLFFTLA
jgi:hypothetical protein